MHLWQSISGKRLSPRGHFTGACIVQCVYSSCPSQGFILLKTYHYSFRSFGARCVNRSIEICVEVKSEWKKWLFYTPQTCVKFILKLRMLSLFLYKFLRANVNSESFILLVKITLEKYINIELHLIVPQASFWCLFTA